MIVPLSLTSGLFRAVVGSVLPYSTDCWPVHKAYIMLSMASSTAAYDVLPDEKRTPDPL